MSMSSIRHGSGPGSAMPLSAETIKVRDKVIERFIDKSLDELTSFLENALQVEKDEAPAWNAGRTYLHSAPPYRACERI